MVEAAAVVLALVLVPLTGGSFRRLARLHFESPWLLFLGLAIQVGLEVITLPRARMDDVGLALLLLSYVLVLGFAVLNVRITGMSVVAIGIACNVLVIALNQGMPYRAPAGARFETTVKHRPERPGDVLRVLDDRIVLPSPIDESISFGDLIIAVGVIDVVFRASRRTRRDRRRGGDHDVGNTEGAVTGRPGPALDLVAAEAVPSPASDPPVDAAAGRRSRSRRPRSRRSRTAAGSAPREGDGYAGTASRSTTRSSASRTRGS